MATTTLRRDYLGRLLLAPTSAATDFLGRVTTSTVDYMGRAMIGTLYTISTLYTTGQYVQLAGGTLLYTTVGGTSAASTPTPPGYGLTVVSGGATFRQETSA